MGNKCASSSFGWRRLVFAQARLCCGRAAIAIKLIHTIIGARLGGTQMQRTSCGGQFALHTVAENKFAALRVSGLCSSAGLKRSRLGPVSVPVSSKVPVPVSSKVSASNQAQVPVSAPVAGGDWPKVAAEVRLWLLGEPAGQQRHGPAASPASRVANYFIAPPVRRLQGGRLAS